MQDHAEIIIADASCLIALYNIGFLDVLRQIYNEVTVTPEVSVEFRLPLPDWMHVEEPTNKELQDLLV